MSSRIIITGFGKKNKEIKEKVLKEVAKRLQKGVKDERSKGHPR
jgi:ribosome-binding factor A